MNLFAYVEEMKELDSTVALISICMLAAFLLVIFFKMLTGMRRGTYRQLVHTGLSLISAAISVIVSVMLSNGIVGSLSSNKLEGVVLFVDGFVPGAEKAFYDAISQINNPEIIEYIILLPASLFVIPIITALLFTLINVIFKIIGAILIKVFKLKRAENGPSRLGGAILGAVEAMLCIMILCLPITGMLTLTDEVCETAINAEVDEDGDFEDIYEEYIVPFTKNPAVSFVSNLGSDMISNAIATVEINGKDVNIRKEITDISDIIFEDVAVLVKTDFKNLTYKDKKAINSVIDALCDSELISSITVGVVQTAAGAIEDGTIPLSNGGDFQPVADEAVIFFSTVSTDTLRADLTTIKELYFIINDSGVLAAMEDGENIMELLQQKSKEGDNTIQQIKDKLQENPRTGGMVTALTKSLISTLIPEDATILVNGQEVPISYETVKDSVSNILNVTKDGKSEEQFKAEIESTLNDALAENQIELEQDVIDEITDHINENYDEIYSQVGDGELTDEQFNDILLSYYNQYLQQNGGNPTDSLPDGIPDGIIP